MTRDGTQVLISPPSNIDFGILTRAYNLITRFNGTKLAGSETSELIQTLNWGVDNGGGLRKILTHPQYDGLFRRDGDAAEYPFGLSILRKNPNTVISSGTYFEGLMMDAFGIAVIAGNVLEKEESLSDVAFNKQYLVRDNSALRARISYHGNNLNLPWSDKQSTGGWFGTTSQEIPISGTFNIRRNLFREDPVRVASWDYMLAEILSNANYN